MLQRLRVSRADIVLAIVLAAATVFVVSLFQANPKAAAEVVQVETRLKAVKQDLANAQKANQAEAANLAKDKADLELLRHRLGVTQAAVAQDPLPWRAVAATVTSDVMLWAEASDVAITAWSADDTWITLIAGKYPAIRHSLSIEGDAEALVAFIARVTWPPVYLLDDHLPAVPVVQTLDMTGVKEKENVWRLTLGLTVAYHQG